MTSFREFLSEAKFDKSAFKGNKSIQAVIPQDQAGRMQNQFQSFDDRVAYGRQMESKIIMALQSAGWQIKPASIDQDKYDKIDGFKLNGGKAVPFQIKYRDSGDDILMEVHKGILPAGTHPNFNGRDMTGSAQIYVCLNRAGNLMRIRSAQEAKEAARVMASQLVIEYGNDVRNRMITTPQGQVRITSDPSNGMTKIMAFLNPHAFKSQQDIKINSGLWAS